MGGGLDGTTRDSQVHFENRGSSRARGLGGLLLIVTNIAVEAELGINCKPT